MVLTRANGEGAKKVNRTLRHVLVRVRWPALESPRDARRVVGAPQQE